MFPVTTQINQLPRTPRKRIRTLSSVANSPQRSPRKAPRSVKKLLDLPLELVDAIFCYLSPGDLVSVLQTGITEVGLFLTERPAIWRDVRKNDLFIEPPPCPPFMEEWDYTALLYKDQCTTCHALSRTIQVDCFVRCCDSCRRNTALYLSVPRLPRPDTEWELLQLLPAIHHRGARFNPIRDLRQFFIRVNAIYTTFSPVDQDTQLDVFRSELSGIKTERAAAVDTLKTWLQTYQQEKKTRRMEVSQRRTTAILGKINDSKLSEIYLALSPGDRDAFLKLNFMKVPKEISNKDWPNIMGKATTFLNELKLAAWYKEIFLQLSHLYLAFTQAQQDPRLLPDFADLCSFPEVRAVVDEHALHVVDMRERLYSHILGLVVPRWQHEAHDAIHYKIPNRIQAQGFRGNLATVWFTAKENPDHSTIVVQFPDVLRVRYAPKKAIKLEEVRGPEDHVYNALLEWPHPQPWLDTHESIVFSTLAECCAHQVVRQAGMNPATALQEDMDGVNLRFVCTCTVPGFIYTWRGAVEHGCHASNFRCGGKLVLLNDDDANHVKQIETQLFDRGIYCARCKPFKHGPEVALRGLTELQSHYMAEHPLLNLANGPGALLGVDFVVPSQNGSSGACKTGLLVKHTNGTRPFSTEGLAGFRIAEPN